MRDIVPNPTDRNPFIDGLAASRAGTLGLVLEPYGPPSSARLAPPLSWPKCECPDDCRVDHENE